MKYIFSIIVLISAMNCFAQFGGPKKEDIPLVKPRLDFKIYHNEHDLSTLRKEVLKHIYISRVEYIMELIPFLPLKVKPGHKLDNVEVPASNRRYRTIKKFDKEKRKYKEQLFENMNQIINYGDTEDIIWAIVYLDTFIGHMNDYIENKHTR